MGSEAAKIYGLTDWTVIIAAFSVNQGAGEDGLLDITQLEPSFERTRGADGSVVRSYTGAPSFELKFKFLQTSAMNGIFSGIHEADKLTNGTGVFPVLIKNNKGSDVFTCLSAWITGPPAYSIGAKAGSVEWTVHTGDGKLILGGS